jgi:hypothetical protein
VVRRQEGLLIAPTLEHPASRASLPQAQALAKAGAASLHKMYAKLPPHPGPSPAHLPGSCQVKIRREARVSAGQAYMQDTYTCKYIQIHTIHTYTYVLTNTYIEKMYVFGSIFRPIHTNIIFIFQIRTNTYSRVH